MDSQFPVQTIVVCGKNEKLYNSLDDVCQNAQNTILRFGYVDNVAELMTAADLIITKAGGLTVSEALTKHLPLVIFNPIPGQEYENTVFLEKIGAGRSAATSEALEEILGNLLRNTGELKKMRLAAAQALPGKSAEQAVESMLRLINKNNRLG